MITKEEALKKISELVTRFEEQIISYKKSDYNETQTRRDFIDPFFKALGWDIDNELGYAEAYREVIHEDRIKVGGATKAPDYSFRLAGGKRLFFVEAKKPSVVVKDDILPAYQVRRYGWSAKLDVSIITDFEEFAVYDCTKKPNPTDKASVARIKYLTYKDYINEFDFLWDTFSKERVLKGGLDKYILQDTNKRGTATVDKEFLQSLDIWRTLLAENIAKQNRKELNEEEINYVVQQTIDRIIFLRIAEDRGVEHYGNLQAISKQKDCYIKLFELFRIADEKYNSGLFDFEKDKISKKVKIDDKTIKAILNELYYPISPYAFSVLSVEILGSAYEQFLGKTITINNLGKAVIELKPEVRKAGGVYYTPQYIVEYIVENTIGKLIEGKTPKEVSDIKILDPACGSGSFLIGAFQFLLDWHRKYYSDNFKSLKTGNNSPLTIEGNLTTSEKKRILLNNIYGVDIDVNAVEVTKLSLLLKCMEGETEASIANQQKLFNERVLPTLDNNIKSGNSLVDVDFYDGQIDFEPQLEKKIKPFNWQSAFPEVFNREVNEEKDELKEITKKAKKHAEKALQYITEIEQKISLVSEPASQYNASQKYKGGFDVIIGNPPYVLLQNLNIKEVFNYTLSKFNSAIYKIDTYQLFIEKSLILLRNNGKIGVITPNTFLKNIHSEPLRKYILDNSTINEIVNFDFSVFDSASVDTCILLLNKSKYDNFSTLTYKVVNKEKQFKTISKLPQFVFSQNLRHNFNLHYSINDNSLLDKINSKSNRLGAICNAYFGIQTFDRTKYVSKTKLNKDYLPVIDGGNIGIYKLKPHTEFVNFLPTSIKSGGNSLVYTQDRICIRQIGSTPIATFVNAGIYTLNTVYNVYLKSDSDKNLKYLLGLINSQLTKYYWKIQNSDEKRTFPKIKKEAILSIPIFINPDKQKHDQIVKLVDTLLQLNKELSEVKLESQREQIRTKIDYCENKINQIVYELYELTPEEIAIVEGAKK